MRKSTTQTAKPVLLSGGNPQIAKADGDGPVQAYISAMPGWKREIGRRLDELIASNALGVHKAVRWNSPVYGIKGQVLCPSHSKARGRLMSPVLFEHS